MGSVRTTLTACLVATLGATALAHGGYYQGPHTPDGVPIPSGPGAGPTTGGRGLEGGPITPPTTGPAVTGRDRKGPEEKTPTVAELPTGIADPPLSGTAWEHWWALHRGRYLRLAAERIAQAPRTRREERERADARDAAADPPAGLAALFRTALRDADADVRAAAAIALARARAPDAAGLLLSVARTDESPDVRGYATLALAMVAEETELPALHDLVNDEEQSLDVRCTAALALGRLGGEDAVMLLGRLVEPDRIRSRATPPVLVAATFHALGIAADPAAGPLLLGALDVRRAHPVILSFAEVALGRLGERAALPVLGRNLVRDTHVSMRRSAALALGDLLVPADAAAVEQLATAAEKDPDPGTRRFATLSLGGIRTDGIRRRLEQRFRSAEPVDRPYLALALGLQGDPAAAPVLRRGLAEDEFEESLQGAYCIALGILGDREARPLLETEVGKMRRTWSPGYAALALAMTGGTAACDAIHARIGRTSDPRLRATLTVALGLLEDPRAVALLEESLASKDSVLESATAAVGLGLLRSRGSVPPLTEAARGKGGEAGIVRATAIGALGRIAAVDEHDLALGDLVRGRDFSLDLPALTRAARVLNDR